MKPATPGRLRAAIVLGMASTCLLAVTSAQQFAEHVEYPAGDEPIWVATGDVNDDGHADVLVINDGDLTASVLLGGADGLGPALTWPVGITGRPAIGDVTGDGHQDLVLPWTPAKVVTVWEGDGTGQFPIRTYAPLPDLTWAVNLADMNGDGVLDMLVSWAPFLSSQTVDVLLSNGDGTYTTTASKALPMPGLSMPAGDFDGDGLLDVAVVLLSGGQSAVVVMLGDGNGGLADPVQHDLVSGNIPRLYGADMNADGVDDLVWLSSTGNTIHVLLADGSGGFVKQPSIFVQDQSDLAFGDLDGDGHLDIAGIQGYGLQPPEDYVDVTVVLGDGAGGSLGSTTHTVALRTRDVAVADLDSDGRLDVVTASWEEDAISVLRNVTLPEPWSDLGNGLAGVDGTPRLVGTGSLEPGSPGSLALTHANAIKLAVLFISKLSTPAPFKGGVLVPVPVLVSIPVLTGADGSLVLSWSSWTGGPPGSDWYFQYGIVDTAAPAGAALSNALYAAQP